jgi:CHAT domain-containing protein
MSGRSQRHHRAGPHQRKDLASRRWLRLSLLNILVCATLCIFSAACNSPRDAQVAYDRIRDKIDHDLTGALTDVNASYPCYEKLSPEWHWRFKTLKAQILISQSLPREALSVLDEPFPPSLAPTEVGVRKILLEGTAHEYLRDFENSERELQLAQQAATRSQPQMICEVLNRQGSLLIDQEKFTEAEAALRQALVLARERKNARQEASILTNLVVASTHLEHFDEAMDWSRDALALSRQLNMQALIGTNLGNVGWASFELGDFAGALSNYTEGAEVSERSGLKGYGAYWLNGVANANLALRRYADAESFSTQALLRAQKMADTETITDSYNTLAELSLRSGQLDQANQYNRQATQLEEQSKDGFGLRASRILAGRIDLRRGNIAEAQQQFREVAADPKLDSALKWELHARLAELYDAENLTSQADREYRLCINTIETARQSVDRDDLRLSYLASGIEFYDDYINFLIAHSRADDALGVAELSRARTLRDGLASTSRAVVPLNNSNRQQISQKFKAAILFYWIGQKQSHLWVLGPAKTVHFLLPAAAQIEPLVNSYRDTVLRIRAADEVDSSAGKQLYAMLVAPAGKLIQKNSSVIILPDDRLAGLNFETLVVNDPQPHFWIEDVTLTTASSLTLLAASTTRATSSNNNLMLVGNTISPNDDFPALPNAAEEIKVVEKYFPSEQREVLEKAAATPTAYARGRPERFAYLHFVTHGTASVTRPLESAVILSKEGDSYKLYAREIVKHPLTAQLVTISACEGAGRRAYSGEGLIGLSWAFLRAGAHNVVGALWEVSDSSTPQFMDTFYGELAKGKDPASALRAAKLSLLHSADTQSVFRKPYYWAPFQLYAGS